MTENLGEKVGSFILTPIGLVLTSIVIIILYLLYKHEAGVDKRLTNFREKHLAGTYFLIGFLTGGIIFVGVWIYAISNWGFLLGIALGWFPAIIAAVIGGLLWPLLVLILTGFLYLIFFNR